MYGLLKSKSFRKPEDRYTVEMTRAFPMKTLQSCIKYSTNKYQYQYQYQWSKYQYKYQYLTFKYQYQYQYITLKYHYHLPVQVLCINYRHSVTLELHKIKFVVSFISKKTNS